MATRPYAAEKTPLQHYLETLGRRWWLILLSAVLCVGAAAIYVATAEKEYEARAQMLVTPVPDDASAVLGLGLIRRSSDPTRDVSTASLLIANVVVAARVNRALRLGDRPEDLLDRISVAPVAQSSVVAITARGGSGRAAAELANAFGAQAVAERTERLHRELDQAIARLNDQITGLGSAARPNGPQARALYDQLATLHSLRAGPDPTLRLEAAAAVPREPVSPRVKLSLVVGLFAGVVFGSAGAFVLSALDSREQREERLHALGLPLLARVPVLRGARRRHAFDEAFRFLRASLRFAGPYEGLGSVAVTSTGEAEGKTTTSFQLAVAAVEAGQRVILVEADPYRPGLRRHLGIPDDPEEAVEDGRSPGLLEYLSGEAAVDEVIRDTTITGLAYVPIGHRESHSMVPLLEQSRGERFPTDLAGRADLVILDCPPVATRTDALLIAAAADGVIFVADARRSDEADITAAIARLRQSKANLLGVVLNRDPTLSHHDYRPPAAGSA